VSSLDSSPRILHAFYRIFWTPWAFSAGDGTYAGSGGDLKGHYAPGVAMILWGLHWLQGSFRLYFSNPDCYKSQASYGLPGFPAWPVEGALLNLLKMHGCTCMCACLRASTCTCVLACECVCVYACVYVRAGRHRKIKRYLPSLLLFISGTCAGCMQATSSLHME